MNTIISYDMIMSLVVNPPSLDPCPNFFNLRALQTHFARALKKVPCPQSAVNGWARAVLVPAMYALIDTNPFNWRINPRTAVPGFPARFATLPDGTQGAALPYSCQEILTITAEHTLNKNYCKTGVNVCRACFDVHDTHIADVYKTAPATAPSTIGWNSTMLPNEIFEQLMSTYGEPTPNAMHQNNLAFIAAYNPKDPPKLLFRHCTGCQEITIIARIPYTAKQLLMNVVDLFMRAGIYARDINNWECRPDANKMYINLHPFIQAAYQGCLASGVITATQSRYATNNCVAGLTAADNVLDDGTTDTIVDSLNTHMANLAASVLLQTKASNDANTDIFDASMNQVAANEAQRNNNHNRMMQQLTMLSTVPTTAPQFAGLMVQQAGRPQAATQCNFIPQAVFILAPAQQWGQPPAGGGGSTRSRNGCGRRNPRGPAQQGAPIFFIGGNQMIPYIPAGMQSMQHPNPCYSNVVKQWANQMFVSPVGLM
jgi:hypothetical protein